MITLENQDLIDEIVTNGENFVMWLEGALGAPKLSDLTKERVIFCSLIKDGVLFYRKALQADPVSIFVSKDLYEEIRSYAISFRNIINSQKLEYFKGLETINELAELKSNIEESIQNINQNINYFKDEKQILAQIQNGLFFNDEESNQADELVLEIQKKKKEADIAVEDINDTKSRFDTEVNSVLTKLNKEVDNQLTKQVQKVYNGEFNSLEKEFAEQSGIWLARLTMAICVLVFYIIGSIFIQFIDAPSTFTFIIIPIRLPDDFLYIAISNGVIISLLSWVVFFFSKNYSINKNLEFIYRQKHTMLQVYPLYADIFSEIGVDKDKVTAELGGIIFNIPNAGFVKGDGSTNDNSPNIINQFLGGIKSP